MTHCDPSSQRGTFLLATNVKDEPNCAEWLLYHVRQGWTHVLLFDDLSGQCPPEVPSACADRVTIRREHRQKTQYMRQAIQFAREAGFEYMFYIDADEYLILPHHQSLDAYMLAVEHRAGQRPDWIQFHWLMFGSAFLDALPDASSARSLIHTYNRSSTALERKVKVMVRVSTVHAPRNPHTYFPAQHTPPNPIMATDTNGLPTKHLTQADIPRDAVPDLSEVWGYLAHYSKQCWTEFCRRRLRPRDDTGNRRTFEFLLRGDKGPPSFHNAYDNDLLNLVPAQTWDRVVGGKK